MVNRRLIFQAVLVLGIGFGFAARAGAQQNTWTYDHVHLAAPDPAAGLDWYLKNMGGQPCDDEGNVVPREKATRMVSNGTMFLFIKTAEPKPSSGSSIDNMAFSFPDVDAKAKELLAAGAKPFFQFSRVIPGQWKHYVIEDPWGARLDLIEDPELQGFHHISISVADPEASMKWYVDAFGGTRGKMKGRVDGIQYGKMWLVVLHGDGTDPSQGHAIDHLGFRPTNMDVAAAKLKTQNVKFTMEPRANPSNGHKIAYVEGPNGVRIELVQH